MILFIVSVAVACQVVTAVIAILCINAVRARAEEKVNEALEFAGKIVATEINKLRSEK